MEHSEKVLSIALVTDDEPAEVLKPSKQPLDLPPFAISPQATAILRLMSSIATLRCD